MTKFYYYHAFLPFLFLICSTLLFDYFRLDLFFADFIYSAGGNSWALKESWLLQSYIHKGGRIFTAVLLLLNLAAVIPGFFSDTFRKYRKGAIYLLVVVVTSLLIVSTLKETTNIDCPWDYIRYGGSEPIQPIFSSLFRSGSGRCFPAGHASGGYAWIALYFVCLLYWPEWRYAGLGFGLLLGALFGFAQELRGAHFFSHDIWTLAICWYIALLGARVLSAIPTKT